MRIALSWLQDLVKVNLPVEELAERLTLAGFEVEEIEDRRSWADGVVVGRVLQREQHPNADRLSVCRVDVGAEAPLTIVCGAQNVRAETWVAVATLGTYLPRIDLKLRSTKLRGVKSEGMICSLSELGLGKTSEGIHLFEGPVSVGSDVRPLLGLNEVVLDVTSTANRADALSMVGLAREVTALTSAPLNLPEVKPQPYPQGGEHLRLSLTEAAACPYYIGTQIEGVQIAPSPNWLQQRLQLAGIRPINNVVDVTNYVLLEYGQPLHAFDLDRLHQLTQGEALDIGVRYANGSETLKTLDGQVRTVTAPALLITANDLPIALAGVMGGEETEVSNATVNLLLEAAWFDPVAVRRSARSQGLRSEASTRYERGVNDQELALACQRAIDLLLEIAGGQVTAQVTADERGDRPQRTILLRLERVQELLGPIQQEDGEPGELAAADVDRILSALGCRLQAKQKGAWAVEVPPYRRRDLEREIDLIEEVARLYGYDNFCDTLPSQTEAGALSVDQVLLRRIREAFRAAGLTELLHYSLVKPTEHRQVQIANPLLAEYSALRTDLLNGLLEAFQFNREQGNGALNGFELGRVFWSDEVGLGEADALAGIMGGDPSLGRWQRGGREQPLDWYQAKGILEAVFARLNLLVEYRPDHQEERLHPGRTASLWLGGDRLGTFGQLHPSLAAQRDLAAEVYLFELDLSVMLDHLDAPEQRIPIFQPFSSYPASGRDLAFFAEQSVSVADLERQMRKSAGPLLQDVELFDQYLGEHVPTGQRSLAFHLSYRAGDRTLTDEEVETAHQAVRDALSEKFRVSLRS
jgi:phenylalanyl-tRNA synthetase beta chain